MRGGLHLCGYESEQTFGGRPIFFAFLSSGPPWSVSSVVFAELSSSAFKLDSSTSRADALFRTRLEAPSASTLLALCFFTAFCFFTIVATAPQ
jgi:hypothetical protein